MSTVQSVDGTASPEDIKLGLENAAGRLEEIIASNQRLQEEFEAHEWRDLDTLADIRQRLAEALDTLHTTIDKVGKALEVREAYQANHMVGDKESLGRN
ncbi:hypothetical protein [Sphaerobacter thermophilus]|uniref:Uncharacterized protein n=1 Tax=Thermocrispum agreste TaxID=37925 RepID=A0A2W4LWM8_9PSEU|nr:MAG: hypothetical protein DIU77_04400 [Thermocrispum agreste]